MFNVKDFDLKLTFESGQPLAFYGDYEAGQGCEVLSYVTGRGVIRMRCRKSAAQTRIDYDYIGDYSAESAGEDIRTRLGLGHDMRALYKKIDTDRFMHEAILALPGLRMTKSEPWEATLCYVMSQANNIKRIRGIVRRLVDSFGEERKDGSECARLFPTSEAISRASVRELMACGTGFRAKYIKSVAKEFADSSDFPELYDLDYTSAKAELTKQYGIGGKVADCILLFGYGKLEAFPVDTWIKRIVEHAYFGGRRKSVSEIHAFAEGKWGPYAGYAQQYLFWHGRTLGVGKKRLKNAKRARILTLN
jgi:N-glycosylase/DNA lyase